MAPVEFHRYIDGRGDTIIFKFDPEAAREPDPKWPNDSPITMYQHYVTTKRTGTVNYHSDLVPLKLAIGRVRAGELALQPPINTVMYIEPSSTDNGANIKTEYVWKGWGHNEGYRRGWAKVGAQSSNSAERVRRLARPVQLPGGKLNAKTTSGTIPQPVDTKQVRERVRRDSVEPEVGNLA